MSLYKYLTAFRVYTIPVVISKPYITPEMSVLLDSIADHSRTDKNTTHSYLALYDQLLFSRKTTAEHVLEIGIGPVEKPNGGSIRLWNDYFDKATVHAIDIIPLDGVWENIRDVPRIRLYTETDAYNAEFVAREFVNTGIRLDMVLDDGPHTLASMIACIELYLPLLTDTGILIIEDVQSMDWLHHLRATVPPELQSYIQTFDLRGIKGRYDDIVFVVDKS